MEQITLAAKKRVQGTKGQIGDIRRAGGVPGIVYGLDATSELVQVVASDLRTIIPKRNHVIELQIEGKPQKVMIKQVDRDPIRRDVTHIDFQRMDEVHPVTVTVPVIPVGVPVGVKVQGGVFAVAKKNVKIRTTIRKIPDNFTIDVSGFEQGKTFYAKELTLEKGTTLVTPGRTALFGVGTGRKEEELPTPGAPAAAAAAAAPAAAAKDGKAAAPAAAAAAGGKDKAAPAAGKGDAKPKK